ncbi:MAG: hypothetical protein WC969_01505 [Elusimicrobiota bacterium]|jgi:hypothetical protein
MREKPFRVLLAVLDAALLLALLRGPRFFPDSASYLDGSLLRPPAYPLLLGLLRTLSHAHGLQALCLLQTAAVLAACAWLTLELRRRLSLGAPSSLVLHLVLASPLLPLPVLTGSVGCAVLTEAFSYAGVLCVAALLLRALAGGSARDERGFIALAAFLPLLRPQFLFLVPVVAAYVLLSLRGADARRRVVLPLFALALFLAGDLSGRLYHAARHRVSAAPSLLGAYLVTDSLYMDEGAPPAAALPAQAEVLVREAREQVAARRLGASVRGAANASLASYFEQNYNLIYWGVVMPLFQRPFAHLPENERLVEADRLLGETGRGLLRAGWLRQLRLSAAAVGARLPVYAALLLLAVLVLAGRRALEGDALCAWIALVTLANLCNHLLVGGLQPVLHRYVFHTEILQWTALALLLRDAFGRARAGSESR